MKKLFTYLLLIIAVTACVNEDHFGLSSHGNIIRIEVSNQANNAIINSSEKSITVEIPAGVDLSEITIEILELTSFASSNKNIGDKLDLNQTQNISITAEDGSTHEWSIESFIASANPQLSNGDFNLWYKTSSNYYEPGADATTTIWGTGNQGTQILNKLATTPTDFGEGNLAAHMETLDNGSIAGTFGAPISAGSIFTGVFNADKIDPSNPEAAIEFGMPFSGRPKSIRLKFSYSPGLVNKDKSGNELDYGDACDIYALFEIRQGGKTERLATAWYRSDEEQTNFQSLEIPLSYGELDQSFPDYMQPIDHGYVSADSASFVLPTHITFVASSSFDGAKFAGAIGSILIIDDIEMIYE